MSFKWHQEQEPDIGVCATNKSPHPSRAVAGVHPSVNEVCSCRLLLGQVGSVRREIASPPRSACVSLDVMMWLISRHPRTATEDTAGHKCGAERAPPPERDPKSIGRGLCISLLPLQPLQSKEQHHPNGRRCYLPSCAMASTFLPR